MPSEKKSWFEVKKLYCHIFFIWILVPVSYFPLSNSEIIQKCCRIRNKEINQWKNNDLFFCEKKEILLWFKQIKSLYVSTKKLIYYYE